MELGHHLLTALQVVIPEAFYHATGNDAEHGRFLVIPVAGNGIYAIVAPQATQNVIGLGQEGFVVYQNGDGLSGDVPAAHTETETLRGRLGFPGTVQHGVFQKIRVAGAVHPHVRSHKNVMPSQLFT